MKLKFQDGEQDYTKVVADDMRLGFVTIEDIENAQQVKLDVDQLKGMLEVIINLKKVNFSEVFLTVENGQPLIIGNKSGGIALATVWNPEEKTEEK